MEKWVYDGNGITEKNRVKLDQVLDIVRVYWRCGDDVEHALSQLLLQTKHFLIG